MAHSLVKDLFYSVFPQKDKFLTFDKGNTNILISAPHGGGIKPSYIPYRTKGNRGQDSYTRRLIQKIIDGLDEKPYYIYADIHRSRIDLNRDLDEATQGNKNAEAIWHQWNSILEQYTDEIKSRYGKGLYIDLHSHNKSTLFELGYGLDVKDYNAIKEKRYTDDESSLSPLNYSEYNLLFGDKSFENTLEFYGFKVLDPSSDKTYLNGGRNIRKYGDNKIGAIQIECPIPVLRNNLDGVSTALIGAIEVFKERFL